MPKLFICVNDLSCVQYFVKLTLCCTYRFKKDGRRLFYSKVFFKTGFQYPQNVWSTNLYQKPGSCILLFSLLHWVHRSLKGHVCCSWCTQTLQRPAVQCKKCISLSDSSLYRSLLSISIRHINTNTYQFKTVLLSFLLKILTENERFLIFHKACHKLPNFG